MFTYSEATPELLERLHNEAIMRHPGDNRYVVWKEQYIREHVKGLIQTFIAFHYEKIIGEVTVVLSQDSKIVKRRPELACANLDIVNINALKVEKAYEGQGVASDLMGMALKFAKDRHTNFVTIGVEPTEVRNLQIYQSWGFLEHAWSAVEAYPPKILPPAGEKAEQEVYLVVYYMRKI
jgi:GNAT superfamily N-acetyltransferase